MAGTYRTPDIYVEEVSLFPPSVAEVETAVPAFIGYTEMAAKYADGDLIKKPTMVMSQLEYEEKFGEGAPMEVGSLTLDENNQLVGSDMSSKFYMYDALRMFFKNGGGKCYIVSVGLYKDTAAVDYGQLKGGLDEVRKVDEPTMLLFPDAVLLESNQLYSLQQDALKQCAELQDRFAIFDLLEKKTMPAGGNFEIEDGPADFRDQIGISSLKYGAAYTPWLKTSLGLEIHYRDIRGKVYRTGVPMSMKDLTDEQEIKDLVDDLEKAVSDSGKMTDAIENLQTNAFPSLRSKYASLKNTFKTAPTVANYEALFNLIYDIAFMVDRWGAGLPAQAVTGDVKIQVDAAIGTAAAQGPLAKALSKLIAYDKGAAEAAPAGLGTAGNFPLYNDRTAPTHAGWVTIFTTGTPPADTTVFGAATTDEAKMRTAEAAVSRIFEDVYTGVATLAVNAREYEKTYEGSLLEQHPVYRNLVKQLATSVTTVPPSGAVAGIYARVDSQRGVWKAPANESLSGAIGVTRVIDFKDQETLNVDVTAGKSINAIRPFTGKGVLVWGARTLAGNDNEWRYINVRRFFIMVEESIKKSTYWAVFEPNDANTWIKVKAMIENYLILKWRDGALQGAKPGDAFFVKIGLGVTMTPLDILEGRMIVEIGMAVVRPAEFIILKFSHKMAVS